MVKRRSEPQEQSSDRPKRYVIVVVELFGKPNGKGAPFTSHDEAVEYAESEYHGLAWHIAEIEEAE